MAEDTGFEFDTRQTRAEVASLTANLDALLSAVNRLDKANLSKASAAMKSFTDSGSLTARQMVDTVQKSVSDLEKVIGNGRYKDFDAVKAVRDAQAQTLNAVKGNTNQILTVHAELREKTRREWQAMTAQALEHAKNIKAAFSDINSLTGKNSGNLSNNNYPPKGLFENAIKERTAMYRGMFNAIEQGQKAEIAGVQAQARADKAMTADRLSNIAQVGRAWKLVQSSKGMESATDLAQQKAAGAAMLAEVQAQARQDKAILGDRTATITQLGKTWQMMSRQIIADNKAMAAADKASASESIKAHKANIDVLNARIAASNKAAAAARTANIGSTGRTLGGAEVMGSYTPINSLGRATEVNQMADSLKKLTINGNDAHSMARGLASGFNALWLTWGNLAPLFAGAAISFGLKKTFDIGSEVEYQIKFMEVLGQTTDAAGKKMEGASTVIRQELRNIDQTTMFTLTELSQAMVRLGQAGQSPAEALMTLRPAADLASAGMVDLKTSTDLLIQTQALFGKSTKDMGQMASQIFLATKSGVLNVEDISGSMKYASESNTRFGKSLEETLTLLGALAQSGIKGASGGTALINFYRDLNGRSGPAIRAMKDLEKATGQTIKVFDEMGKQRSGIDIFNDIATASSKLKAVDADKLLAKIFSDRGGRTFFAMIRDGTIDLNKMKAELEAIKDGKLVFEAAQGLMDTTKGAVNLLGGALVGSLDQVFEAYSKEFKTFITDMTAVVNSDGFKLGVAGMVDSISKLYNMLKSASTVLVPFLAAWAGFKTLSIGVGLLQSMAVGLAALVPLLGANARAYIGKTMAIETNTIALVGNVAASRAVAAGATAEAAALAGSTAARTAAAASFGTLGLAMRGVMAVLGFLANPIVGTTILVASLGAAFLSAKSSAEGGMSGAASATLSNGKVIESQLLKEIQLARTRNLLVAGDAFSKVEAELEEKKRRQKRLGEQTQFLEAKSNGPQFSDATRKESAALHKLAMADMIKNEKEINQAQADIDAGRLDTVKQQEKDMLRIEAEARKASARAQAEADAAALKANRGPGGRPTFTPTERLTKDNTLAEITKLSEAKLASEKRYYDNSKVLMDAEYSAKLISDGTYQAKALSATLDYENKSIRILKDASDEYILEYEIRKDEIEKLREAARKGKDTNAVNSLTAELDNLKNAKDTVQAASLEKIFQIEDTAATRLRMSVIAAAGELRKLAVDTEDYWAKNDRSLASTSAMDQIAEKYRVINESILSNDKANRAAEEAYVQEFSKHQDLLSQQDTAIKNLTQTRLDYVQQTLESGKLLYVENAEKIQQLDEQLAKLNAIREASGNAAVGSASLSANNAFSKTKKSQWDDLSNGLTDAVTTSIFEGSKAGGKKMKQVLQDELIKKPLKAFVQAGINYVANGAMNMLGGLIGGGGGGGGAGGGAGGGGGGGIGLGGIGTIAQAGYNVATTGSLFGSAAGGASGGMAGGMGSMMATLGPIAAFVAIAALIGNVLGVFRSKTIIGSGLQGTLGNGSSLTPWEEERTGGTLLDGSSFETYNPLEAYRQWKKNQALMAAEIKEGTNPTLVGGTSRFASPFDDPKKRKEMEELEAASIKQSEGINKAYEIMRKSVVKMADSLNLGGSKVANFAFTLSQQDLNFKDLKPEEINEKIATAIAKGGNEMAQMLIGSWEEVTTTVVTTVMEQSATEAFDPTYHQDKTTTTELVYKASEFAKAGETALETLTRLSTSFTAVNDAASALGYGTYTASLGLAAAADKIVEAFGGLEAFMQTTGSFINNFFTSTERRDALADKGAREISALSGPDGFKITGKQLLGMTRDEFKNAVLAMGSDPGLQKQLMDIGNNITSIWEPVDAALDNTASAADNLTDAVDEVTQSFNDAIKSLTEEGQGLAVQLLRAQGNDKGADLLARQNYLDSFVGLDDARKNEIAKLYDANRAMEKLIETTNSLREELPALMRRFRSDRTNNMDDYGINASLLVNAGWFGGSEKNSMKDVNTLRDIMSTMTKTDIEAFVTQALKMPGVTDDMRLSLVRVADSLIDIKDVEADQAMARADAAFSQLQRTVDAQRKTLEETSKKAQENIATLKEVFDVLDSSIKELYKTVNTTKKMLAAQGKEYFDSVLATLQGGGKIDDSKKLNESVVAMKDGVTEAVYASQFEEDRARLQLAGRLSLMKDIVGEQLTVEELILKNAEEANKELDRIMENAQSQMNALNGINNGVNVTLPAALAALGSAISGAYGAQGAAGRPIAGQNQVKMASGTIYTSEQVQGGVNYVNDMVSKGDLVGLYQGVKHAGVSMADFLEIAQQAGYSHLTAEGVTAWAEGNNLPKLATGTNYVPEDGAYYLHKGESVVPEKYNPFAKGATSMESDGGDEDGGSVTGAINQLREEQRIQHSVMAELVRRQYKVIDKWDKEGLPQERQEEDV
jgi:TP901 family phage tail tape measure protein